MAGDEDSDIYRSPGSRLTTSRSGRVGLGGSCDRVAHHETGRDVDLLGVERSAAEELEQHAGHGNKY